MGRHAFRIRRSRCTSSSDSAASSGRPSPGRRAPRVCEFALVVEPLKLNGQPRRQRPSPFTDCRRAAARSSSSVPPSNIPALLPREALALSSNLAQRAARSPGRTAPAASHTHGTGHASGALPEIAKEARDERQATEGTTSRTEPAIVSAERRTGRHGFAGGMAGLARASIGSCNATPASNTPDRARDYLLPG